MISFKNKLYLKLKLRLQHYIVAKPHKLSEAFTKSRLYMS